MASLRRREPTWARITVFVLAGLFRQRAPYPVMCVTKIDRVVTSVGGKMVSTERLKVFQALDASIIKSIDVREGDEVKAKDNCWRRSTRHLPPPTSGNCSSRSPACGRRSRATTRSLDNRPFDAADGDDPDTAQIRNAVQREYYNQQVAQYKAQLRASTRRFGQTQATVQKYQTDESRYQQREEIAEKIEDMRATLAAHGTGLATTIC